MSYKDFTPDTAAITDLRLDQRNPRIGQMQDQNQCISAILDNKNFINLVNDIALNGVGISPVVAYENNNSPFVVMDGNRRVTALKLLENPKLASGHILQKRIEDASKLAKEKQTIPEKVEIQKSSNLRAIYEHMRLTHTGELEGVGQRRWTAMSQAIFAIDQGIDDDNIMAAKLVLFAHENYNFVFDDDYPITVLTRLISKERLAQIGILYEAGKITWHTKSAGAEKVLLDIVTDIRDKTIKTDDIFTKEEQKSYLERLFSVHNLHREIPPSRNETGSNSADTNDNKNGAETDPNSTGNTDNKTETPQDDSGTGKTDDTKTNGRRGSAPVKASWDRLHVVHRNKHRFDFSGHSPKFGDLYNEMARLELDGKRGTPIAAAFCVRAFTEMAVQSYRKKNSTGGEREGLAEMAKRASDDLFKKQRITSDINQLIIRYASNDNFLSISTLHKYVHSGNFHPNKQNVNTIWDELYPFLVECLKG